MITYVVGKLDIENREIYSLEEIKPSAKLINDTQFFYQQKINNGLNRTQALNTIKQRPTLMRGMLTKIDNTSIKVQHIIYPLGSVMKQLSSFDLMSDGDYHRDSRNSYIYLSDSEKIVTVFRKIGIKKRAYASLEPWFPEIGERVICQYYSYGNGTQKKSIFSASGLLEKVYKVTVKSRHGEFLIYIGYKLENNSMLFNRALPYHRMFATNSELETDIPF